MKPVRPPAVRPQRRTLVLAGAGAALGLPLWATRSAWAATPTIAPATLPGVGRPLDLPVMPVLGGGHYGPTDAQGKLLVLYYFATWCPFCKLQSPRIDALWRTHRAQGLEVLALSIDKETAPVTAWQQQHGYRFPVVMLQGEAAAALPKPRGLPVTVVRGRDGRVALIESGEMLAEDVADIAKWL